MAPPVAALQQYRTRPGPRHDCVARCRRVKLNRRKRCAFMASAMSVKRMQSEAEAFAAPLRAGTVDRGRPHRVVAALMLREMVTTYGRSPGGWLWALLEPIAAIALLAFAFSLVFRDPPLGSDFALFYATGFLPYMVFHDISGKVASALRFSKPLFSFGRVRVIDAVTARIALNALTHAVIGTVVLTALLVLSDTNAALAPGLILEAYTLALALAVGAGVLNCYLFTAFPAWERLWNIALRPLFIVSGVVFLLEDVPDAYQPYLLANPLFHVTGMMRAGVYPTYEPLYPSTVYVFAIAAALLVLGMLLLDAFADEVLHK